MLIVKVRRPAIRTAVPVTTATVLLPLLPVAVAIPAEAAVLLREAATLAEAVAVHAHRITAVVVAAVPYRPAVEVVAAVAAEDK